MSLKQSHPKKAFIRKEITGDYSFPFHFHSCPRHGQKPHRHKNFSTATPKPLRCDVCVLFMALCLVFVLYSINARENTMEVDKIIHIYTHTYLYTYTIQEENLSCSCLNKSSRESGNCQIKHQ